MHSPALNRIAPVPGRQAHPVRTGWFFFSVMILTVSLIVTPVSGIVVVEYFHQQGCIYCEKTDPLIESLRTQYGDRITLEKIEVGNRDSLHLLMSYGVTEIPVVVINRNRVLTYPEITPGHLDEEIRRAESGAYPVPAERQPVLSRDPLLAAVFSLILGIMTGLSPCLLGSLVVLMAASGNTGTDGKPGMYYPLAFGTGIVAAYVLVAAGILGAGMALVPDSGSRPVIFGIGGILAIAIGMVQTGLFSLPDRINQHTSSLVSRFHTLPGILVAGLLFAVLFAPCAIAPFLVLTGTLLVERSLMPALMLLAFAAGILAPYIAIAIFQGTARELLLKYAGIVQKAGGILLIVFGIWLLLSV